MSLPTTPAPAGRAEQALQAIPFGYLIGAPLVAVIEAQAQAAQTTVEFIQKVGFTNPAAAGDAAAGAPIDAGDVRMVKFRYEKATPAGGGAPATASLDVPVLSIVPVPFIRIEEATIDFTARIVDIVKEDVKTVMNTTHEASGSYGGMLSPVKVGFKSTFSYNRDKNSESRFEKEYQMHVTVRAVQDDMPAGLARVLNILENLITEKSPAPAST